MATVPQFPTGTLSRSSLNNFVTETTTNITDANIATGANIATSKLALTATGLKAAMYLRNYTTDALTTNQVIYRGWSYIGGSGTPSVWQTVTLPNSGFDDTNYTVLLTYRGAKNGSNPSTVVDVAANPNNITVYLDGASPATTTQFTMVVADTDGVNLAVANRYVYSWIAIGTKA